MWNRPADLALTFGISYAYCLGLWLVNGLAADWLNRYLSWGEQPMRRLFATLAVSLGGSLLVILLVQVGILLIIEHSLAGLWGPSIYGRVLLPLAFTVIISLFNHSRSFFLALARSRRAGRAPRKGNRHRPPRLPAPAGGPAFPLQFPQRPHQPGGRKRPGPRRALYPAALARCTATCSTAKAQELVPLADEVRFAESYLFLQKTRLGEALAVEMSLPPTEIAPFFVPPLALQLLLENVIKHNTAFQADPLHCACYTRCRLPKPSSCATPSGRAASPPVRPRAGA